MKLLTDRQRQQVVQTIRDHHLAFMAEVLGPESISKEDYQRLRAAGKIRAKPAMKVDAPTAAHALGTLTAAMPSEDAEKLSGDGFWKILDETHSDLTQAEREAVSIARARIGQHITGLGNKIEERTGHYLIDADDALRRKRLTTVRREVARGLEARESARQIATRIQNATKDVKRNWLQVAQTEVHNAVEEGKAAALVKEMPEGSDPLVYKRPRPDACPFCVLLYLKEDKKTPRVFRLSELMANGTNVGRKANRPRLHGARATEWKAVLGAMHPWCGCTLHHMPEGMGFDAEGRMTYVGVRKARVEIESLNKALLNHTCDGAE